MNKSTKWILALACVVALLSAAVSLGYACRGNSDALYRSSRRNVRLANALIPMSSRLPKPLDYPFRYFGFRAWKSYRAQNEALLASGYITNVSITLTNASAAFTNTAKTPSRAEILRCLREAVPRNDGWNFSLSRDPQRNLVTVEVTCRSNNLSSYRRALEHY